MTQRQNILPKCLLGVAIVCFLLALFPARKGYTDPETDEQVTEWSIGLPFSPLWKYMKRDSATGMKMEMGIRFLSWSWIPFVAGGLCLKLRRHYGQMLVNVPADDSSDS